MLQFYALQNYYDMQILIYPRVYGNQALGVQSRKDHRGRDRMVVGFTTTCAIGACHH